MEGVDITKWGCVQKILLFAALRMIKELWSLDICSNSLCSPFSSSCRLLFF